jgi:AbrB family looped-hinge helix DNA binding protein
MAIVKVQRNGQVTIPAAIRARLSLAEGDLLEVATDNQTIVLKPRAGADRLAEVDAALEESFEDARSGRTVGPFDSVEELEDYRRDHRRA